MIGKVRRAFRKAGKPDAPETELIAFAQKLVKAGVDITSKTSSRIAKAVRGDVKPEDLK